MPVEMSDDEPFEIVSDFRAAGAGRGCIDPPRDPWTGEVIRPRPAPPADRRVVHLQPARARAAADGRCATAGCGRVVQSRGVCWSCYGRARRAEQRELMATLGRIRDRWGAEAAEHVRGEIDRVHARLIGDAAELALEAEQALLRMGTSTVRRTG